MIRKAKEIYDAFPTKAGAMAAARDLNKSSVTHCPMGAVVRKLRPAQDGGRLKYGVYVTTHCFSFKTKRRKAEKAEISARQRLASMTSAYFRRVGHRK